MNQHSTIARLYKQEYGTLDYDPSVPCIIATHIGFATDEEFKGLLNLGLAYAIEKKKHHSKIGWLADTSLMDGSTIAEWVVSDWNPRVLAEGICYLAFVLPKDIFGNLQIQDYNQLNTENNEKLITASFENVESAKVWLHEALYVSNHEE